MSFVADGPLKSEQIEGNERPAFTTESLRFASRSSPFSAVGWGSQLVSVWTSAELAATARAGCGP